MVFFLAHGLLTEALAVPAVKDEAASDENTCKSLSRLRSPRLACPARSIAIAHEAQLLN
jgi:hypothetical protein